MSDESFEAEVPTYTAQLPSATLGAEQEYPRGTVLNLNVQVRVIGHTENEDKKGNLIHKHNLVLEEVSIVDFLTPAQRRALIEAAERDAEEQERLAAGGTITEETHIEDVLPGQTTLEEQIEQQAQDAGRAEFERLRAESWGNEDERGYAAQGAYYEAKERLTEQKFDYIPTDNDQGIVAGGGLLDKDDDDDPEHAWMDEEEDFAHGVRVEVGF